ncbi:hypothetical protein ERJ77_27305, partial [Vibrio anguillarum]|nr:hypothetical protein [Vibrio anguillarum]
MNLKKHSLTVALSALFWSQSAWSVVCVDAIGNGLQLEEMASSALRWAEEKSALLAEYTQNEALSYLDNMKAEYRASAQISAITTSTSTTANAASEERYAASPSACGTLARAKAFVAGVTTCDDPIVENSIQARLNRIADCSTHGSKLNCNKVSERRNEIAQVIVKAVNERDGDTLVAVLDGGVNFGLTQEVMSPENQALNDAAFDLILG